MATNSGFYRAASGDTRPVFGAAVQAPAGAPPVREGNVIGYYWDNLFSSAGTVGSRAVTGRATLRSNGKVLATTGLEGDSLTATVPPGRATYTLTTEAATEGPLTSRLSATWRFTSARTTKATPIALPYIHMSPAGLNDLNQAPAGRPTKIDLTVEGPTPTTLTVQSSPDRGRTWTATTSVTETITDAFLIAP